MLIKNTKVVAIIPPGADNPRNSEGSFITLDDGRIAFVYSKYTGGSFEDGADCDIACIYSYDGGESFDTENIEILIRARDFGEQNVMSVTTRRMDNGDIGLFFLLKKDEGGLHTEYILRRYTKDFRGAYTDVKVGPERFPGYYVVNNDRVIRLKSGRWLTVAALHPTSQHPDEADVSWLDHKGILYSFYSDDDGFTWHTSDFYLTLNNPNSTSGLQEPGCVELPAGAVYGYARTDLKCHYETVSVDGGETWFPPRASRFLSPNSPLHIKKNEYSEKYYAIWNPVPNYFGRKLHDGTMGRTPYVIAESSDGITFSEPQILEDDETRGFCYPAVHFLDKTTALIAYCSGGGEDGNCLTRITVRKIFLEI